MVKQIKSVNDYKRTPYEDSLRNLKIEIREVQTLITRIKNKIKTFDKFYHQTSNPSYKKNLLKFYNAEDTQLKMFVHKLKSLEKCLKTLEEHANIYNTADFEDLDSIIKLKDEI